MARTADDAPLIPLELPVADGDHRERADAQRNRLKVLAAAERLFACHGVENVSMDAIAAEAGVGKGTLFRRFGDRAGLALALLHEQTAALQEQIIRGPAPLGPGAPPKERL
jgi:AcrR family transcriptional regulator